MKVTGDWLAVRRLLFHVACGAIRFTWPAWGQTGTCRRFLLFGRTEKGQGVQFRTSVWMEEAIAVALALGRRQQNSFGSMARDLAVHLPVIFGWRLCSCRPV